MAQAILNECTSSQTPSDFQQTSTTTQHAEDLLEDILSEIMLLNATDPNKDLKSRASSTRSCSQVCRHWREVALGCTKLWACIIDYQSDSVRWMQELLDRSLPLPLSIPCDLEDADPLHWTEPGPCEEGPHLREILLLNHKERWRYLSISGLPDDRTSSLRLIPDYILQPAPHIYALKLTSFDWRYEYSLTGTLFADHAPSLRRLDLCDVSIEFDALQSISGQLEDLSLSWNEHFIGGPEIFTQWMQFLRSTPRLRCLRIRDTRARVGQINMKQSSPIPLNRLEKIFLELSYPPICKSITDLLDLPATCEFLVFCLYLRPSFDLSAATAMIQQRLRMWDPNPTCIRSLYAKLNGDRWSFSNSELEWPEWGSSSEQMALAGRKNEARVGDPRLNLIFGIPSQAAHFQVFMSILSAFKSSFPTTTHLRLWVSGEPRIANEESMLASVFSDFLNLKTLEFHDAHRDVMITTLRQHVSGTILLPALKSINILPYYSTQTLDVEAIDRIKEFLQWRKEQGLPLSTIKVGKNLPRESAGFKDLSRIVEVLE